MTANLAGLEDRLAIQEVIARYSSTYDGGDADGFAGLFAEDGVFEVFVPGLASATVRLESRMAIREWAARRLRERRGRFTSRHHQSGTIFDALTPAAARTRTMVLVTHQGVDDPAPRPIITGVYHDRWRKTPAGWQLAHRTAHVDGDPGLAPPARVYQFRIALSGVAPPIWRSIQVPETYSFWDLHVAIQDAMGWLDYHLHVFRVTRPGTGEVVQIGIPDDDPFEGEEPDLPGWEILIAPHFPRPGTTARYTYDLGDDWEHELTLEAILPREPRTTYPRCVGGARACPPEDCGGIFGYEDLLGVIRDPTHQEHEAMLQWLGGGFDPERFDPRRVKFDDPARRYALAFEEDSLPQRRRPRHRTARAATRRPRSRAKRPRR